MTYNDWRPRAEAATDKAVEIVRDLTIVSAWAESGDREAPYRVRDAIERLERATRPTTTAEDLQRRDELELRLRGVLRGR